MYEYLVNFEAKTREVENQKVEINLLKDKIVIKDAQLNNHLKNEVDYLKTISNHETQIKGLEELNKDLHKELKKMRTKNVLRTVAEVGLVVLAFLAGTVF